MKHFATLARALLLGTAITLCSPTLLAATPKSAPNTTTAIPEDSVYQLSLPLTDQQARSFDWRARRGKPQLVSMFYTSCQYICPLIVDSGKAIEKNLTPAQQQRLGILLISIDPARDDAPALAGVASERKLDPGRWTLAAPRASDVRSVAGV